MFDKTTKLYKFINILDIELDILMSFFLYTKTNQFLLFFYKIAKPLKYTAILLFDPNFNTSLISKKVK